MIYDDIDMKNARGIGFWTGALAGVVGTLLLCALVGLYLV